MSDQVFRPELPCADAQERSPVSQRSDGWRAIPTTCVETIGGDPDTAVRLSFQIKVF